MIVGCGREVDAGCEWRLVEIFDGSAEFAESFQQRGLRGRLRIEADEKDVDLRSYVSGGEGSSEKFSKLSLGEILRFVATALEFDSPPGKGSGVGIARVGVEKPAPAISVQQLPGMGGGLGERIDWTKTGGGSVRCDNCAPEGLLLGGIEQKVGGVPFNQQLLP